MQDRQSLQGDDVTRRDLAQFDQFLDGHRDIAEQLRRTPSLINDPQYLQSHPELNDYLQAHPSVKQEISAQPDTFMRFEDQWARDRGMRDRDAGGQFQATGRIDARQRDAVQFDQFLDQHDEIGELVRKDPSRLDDRKFVNDHPVLQAYLQDHPGVREQLRQDPGAFMALAARDNGGVERFDDNADRREAIEFNQFLDQHREIGEQVRKDPSLLDNRKFVDSHPALQAYLQEHQGVEDQIRQNPNGFVQLADRDNGQMNHVWNREPMPMRDHMADFGGFLGSHEDIRNDLAKNPMVVKDQQYVQSHQELDAYLNAHPDVRSDLMANPQDFCHGAQEAYMNGSTGVTGGAGVSGRGTAGASGAAGTSTGTSMNPATTTTHGTKPNQ